MSSVSTIDLQEGGTLIFDLCLMGLDTDYTFRVNFVTLIGNSLLYCSV
jgi:hypothetical protein